MDLAKLQAAVKARKEQIDAKKTAGTKLAKIPAGTSRWRILPGWRAEEREIYYHDFGQFWFKNADGKVAAVIVSEGETFGRPDEIAELIWGAYRAAADKATKDRLKELLPNRSVLVNAIQTGGPGADPNKVVPLPMPSGLAGKFHELLMSRLEFGINVLDLEKGRDVIITKTGTGLNTEYSMVDAPAETAVNPAVMDQLTNFDAFIEHERQEGLKKGIGPVNDAIAIALGGTAPSARASLTSVLPSAAALAAPTPTPAPLAAVAPAPAPVAVPVMTAVVPPVAAVAPAPAPAAPAPATTPGVQVPGFGGVLDDAELQELLGQLEPAAA